jgi:hypothetical protein
LPASLPRPVWSRQPDVDASVGIGDVDRVPVLDLDHEVTEKLELVWRQSPELKPPSTNGHIHAPIDHREGCGCSLFDLLGSAVKALRQRLEVSAAC